MYHSIDRMSIFALRPFSRRKTVEYYTLDVSNPNHFLTVTVTESEIE